MPVNPNAPEPLKTALERMEASVQSTKKSLAFAAPEIHDLHWATLQENLADTLTTLYDESYL
jgi:uncharacterized membrane protein YgaE (UPF0421/DUF939 family)